MNLNEYNKVKSITVAAGYDVGVTDMINVHRVMRNPFNHVCNKI